jgi:uncharacterized protein YggT (Ycf19 family)
MVGLLWILRACSAIVIVWALLSWVPHPIAGHIRSFLGYAVAPVVNLFSFASFGAVSLAPWIVVLILMGLERLVFNKIIKDNPHFDPQDLR